MARKPYGLGSLIHYSSSIVFLYRGQLRQVKAEMRTDTLDRDCAAWFPSGNDRNGEVCPYGFNSHNCSDLIQETFKCWSGQAKKKAL